MAQLLITGGSGFIGSHTCLVLIEAGHDLVVIDNFSNSSPEALERVRLLAGISSCSDQLKVIKGDIRSKSDLRKAFRSGIDGREIDAVVHFAGLKAVGESVKDPLRYWDVNTNGSQCLLTVMREEGCRSLAFSSSATLYGLPELIPVTEDCRIEPINPYGSTKAAVEQMLRELNESEQGWRIACLRYFNPVGAHPSGLIGEDPNGIPNNLFPFISQVAIGKHDRLSVFGSDWPTPDGSGVRDYIHVVDLALGHQAAVEHLLENGPQFLTLNLGTGEGHSVLEVVKAFERASGQSIELEFTHRRDGDVPTTIADVRASNAILGWSAKKSLEDMCIDGWNWQKLNPSGYSSSMDNQAK